MDQQLPCWWQPLEGVYSTIPVLTCAEAVSFERSILGSEEREWEAMQKAGKVLGRAIFEDFTWWRSLPQKPRLIVFAGKGHNAADAILASIELRKCLGATSPSLTIVWVMGRAGLKPLLVRAAQRAEALWGEALIQIECTSGDPSFLDDQTYDVCLDGIVGMQFKGPWRGATADLVRAMNHHRPQLGFRVAVDLPSGLSDAPDSLSVQADVTYATGILKSPALKDALEGARSVGRLRYLDLGFFDASPRFQGDGLLDSIQILDTVGRLRDAGSYKKTFGRVAVFAGSYQYPGAALMAIQAALRAGAGLVTGFVPSGLIPAFAAHTPEAIWHGLDCRETGMFSLDAAAQIQALSEDFDALVIGPGWVSKGTNLALLAELVMRCPKALILDAGALVADLGASLRQRPQSFPPVVLTPHVGEFRRLLGAAAQTELNTVLKAVAQEWNVLIVLKGPVSRITQSGKLQFALAGNPVLARGGSGDVLSGILGARLALSPSEPLLAAQEAVVWQGAAADCLARARGGIAVNTTQLHAYLGVALRG